jgi:succinate-acetate transporter protein
MAPIDVESAPVAPAAVSAIANPAPLGLCGFALTTFVLSAANAGLFTGATIVIGLAIFYGGLAQLLAGMWEFKTGNTFGATAFTSYGAFWLSVAAILLLKLVPADHPEAMGVFLLGWTIFTGLMLIASMKTTKALILLFALLFVTFIFLTVADLGGPAGAKTLGGYLGLLTAAVAWYNALAALLAAGASGVVLPVGKLS